MGAREVHRKGTDFDARPRLGLSDVGKQFRIQLQVFDTCQLTPAVSSRIGAKGFAAQLLMQSNR
jgi:hypothetical protein